MTQTDLTNSKTFTELFENGKATKVVMDEIDFETMGYSARPDSAPVYCCKNCYHRANPEAREQGRKPIRVVVVRLNG
jgi:hypothetical protein